MIYVVNMETKEVVHLSYEDGYESISNALALARRLAQEIPYRPVNHRTVRITDERQTWTVYR